MSFALCQRPRLCRAVTFLEIMIVLVILGVLVSVVTPSFRGMLARQRLTASAREFAYLARYARQQAILRHAPTEIRVNPEQGMYRLYLTPPDVRRRTRTSVEERREDVERTHWLDEEKQRVVFESVSSDASVPDGRRDVVRVRFHRNGAASATTLVVRDQRKRKMTIEIAGATGSVRVYSGAPTGRKEASL